MPVRAFKFNVFCLLLVTWLAACAPAAPATAPVAEEPTLVLPSTFTPTPTATQAATHTPAPPQATATATPAPMPSTLSIEDQIAIYTAVIERIYTVDHTFAQNPHFPVVYLVSAENEGSPLMSGPEAPPRDLDPAVREGVLAALASPSVHFEWAPTADAVPRDENHAVAGGGAIITLGAIQPLAADKVALNASIFIAPLAAGGFSYVLESTDGAWRITDSGMQWIS